MNYFSVLLLLHINFSLAEINLKILSFNVRTSNAADPCPSGCWQERAPRCIETLRQQSADFVATQELTTLQFNYIKNHSTYKSIGTCANDCATQERVSIFYRTDYWNLIEEGTFYLSDTPDTPSNSWRNLWWRICTWGRFSHQSNPDKVICIFNTHYDFNQQNNLKASKLIAERMKSICQENDLVVLTGDFNEEPQAPAIRYLIGISPFREMFTPLLLTDSLKSSKSYTGTSFAQGDFTTSLAGPQIDYIFYKKCSSSCLLESKTIRTLVRGYYPTDHSLVMAKFCIGKDCKGCQ